MTTNLDKLSPLILLSAGGSGGHLFPAEALANELRNRGFRLAMVTDRRGGSLGKKIGVSDIYEVIASGVAGKSIFGRVISLITIAAGTIQARILLSRIKPTVVVGFGGYASVPAMLAASYSSVATVIHEQNAILGRANRFLAKKAQLIAASYTDIKQVPESARGKVVHTGMPVRGAVNKFRNEPYKGIVEGKDIYLLIFGGSQGASVFSRVLPEAVERLSKKIREHLSLSHQARAEDCELLRQTYNRMGINAEVATFFEDLPDRMSKAHLIICRSGASTIAEVTTIGRPAILVPFPYAIDDHQVANANVVDDAGGGWVIPDEVLSPEILSERLDNLLSGKSDLEKAANQSKRLGCTNAAEQLAEAVIGIVNRKSKIKNRDMR
ncbi:MAG: undecaprenyldiphospho-muramoylpentapeptide beta-N-acetylglucosaminyltransferase [Pseudomonadota bacterium]|nr:undecaprenyldiphospho-muramoylpentapeptide beta-N-acetylglucosaminyltransferase [Pseudomonadota bacterium]